MSYKAITLEMVKSFKKFHADIDIDIAVYDNEQVQKIIGNNSERATYLSPIICMDLINKYDSVIHIDGDCLVTDKLTEIFESIEAGYDAICVRNNNDYDMAFHMTPGYSRVNMLNEKLISVQQYQNLGTFAVSNKQFVIDWLEHSIKNVSKCLLIEQDTFNDIFYSDKYNCVCVDPKESKVFYGLSSRWGSGDSKEHWLSGNPITLGKTFESWKQIQVIDNKLVLNNKIIKILHYSGGWHKPDKNWTDIKTFLTNEVWEYMSIIRESK